MDKDNVWAIYEIDLEYSLQFHALHKDLPLASDHYEFVKYYEYYVVINKNWKFYLKHDLVLRKVQTIIALREADYLKGYINHRLRQEGTNDFEKDFFKLMNNVWFAKTMENVRKKANIKIITCDEQRQKSLKN